MLKTKTTIIFTLLTIACIAIMFYVSEATNVELSHNQKKAKPPQSVNFIVSNMNLIINDTDGSIKANIKADNVKHNASNNQTQLVNPELTLNQPNSSLVITADNGKILHNKQKIKLIEKIILTDNVVIHRTNKNNNTLPYIKLETTSLNYMPSKDIATTKDKVTILTQNSKTIAQGLIVNKQDQKLQLLENVQSSYSPELTQKDWTLSQSINSKNAKDKT